MKSVKNGGRKCFRDRQHAGLRCALAAVVVAIGTAPARAQCVDVQELTASGASIGDEFGSSVSISGDTVLVGTSGEAYIFRFNGTTWVEEQELAVSDPGLATFFGETVSISGGTAVVGAWADVCAAGLDCGSAYVFRFNGTDWIEDQKLIASAPAAGDRFGNAVSVSGDTAVVGANQDDRAGFTAGSAYVFRFNGTSWAQEQKLTASDAAAGDEFGHSVSVSGDAILVGAWFDGCAAGRMCGAVYMFRFDGASWVEEQKLTASDAGAFDVFGNSVSVNGDTALVGASDSAYVFRFNGAAWVETQKLSTSGAGAFSRLGSGVAITDEVAVVGASQVRCADGTDCGAAYVFQFDGIGWRRVQTLTATGARAGDRFGNAVSASGSTTVVGAFLRDRDPHNKNVGAAYVVDCQSACGDGNADLGEQCDGGIACTECLCDSGLESTVPPSADCRPICGNRILDPGEECDRGLGCADCVCLLGFEPTVPPSLNCRPICGNGNLDSGEECDSGLGCRDCLCDSRFEPTVPPSVDCRSTCDNGILDPGEECDGGVACTDCRCDSDSGPTVPPSLDCGPACGDGNLDLREQCDGGLACTDCRCDLGFEPTFPRSVDCQLKCGNGRIDTGEECDGGIACVDCLCDAGFEPTKPRSVDCGAICVQGCVQCLVKQKLSNSDEAAFVSFGRSVSVSGDTAVVGAPNDDCVAGIDCGAAYVYRFDGNSWVEEQKLTAADAAARDAFGISVAVSGNTAFVVTSLVRHPVIRAPSAYVFRFNGTSWVETQKLTAFDVIGSKLFGSSISLSGDTAVLGGKRDACASGIWCGSAYMFRFNGTSWVEEQRLIPSDIAEHDGFGDSVSVSGDTALVGAPGDDCASGINCGATYVFRFDGASWAEEQKLTASDAGGTDLFGTSVSLYGDTILVGASWDDDRRGSVYAFRFDGTSWGEEQKLTAPDVAGSPFFGESVSVSGATAVVGAGSDSCSEGQRCGSVYVFRFNGTSWVQEQELAGSTVGAFDEFGFSVSLSGDRAVVGAMGDDCEAGSDCGSAYMFSGVSAPTIVNLDIKPGSCPNRVNPRSKAVVNITIVGSSDFDVATIDPDSLTLARTDCVGESVSPYLGRRGPRVAIKDVTTPFEGEPCACHEFGGDGLDDLTLKFSMAEMSRGLKLGELPKGETIELVLRGRLQDGTAFEARDCILIPGMQRTSSGLRRSGRSK